MLSFKGLTLLAGKVRLGVESLSWVIALAAIAVGSPLCAWLAEFLYVISARLI